MYIYVGIINVLNNKWSTSEQRRQGLYRFNEVKKNTVFSANCSIKVYKFKVQLLDNWEAAF
jgi:hypothetical protein